MLRAVPNGAFRQGLPMSSGVGGSGWGATAPCCVAVPYPMLRQWMQLVFRACIAYVPTARFVMVVLLFIFFDFFTADWLDAAQRP